MKFRPLTDSERSAIIAEFIGDSGIGDLILKYRRSFETIKKIWKETYTDEDYKARVSRLCRLHKVGDKNPMFGKTGMLHHNSVERSIASGGYVKIFAPSWYEGSLDGGKAYEHIVVYCATHDLPKLPEGWIIHHKDENRTNNCPSNLEAIPVGIHLRQHNTKNLTLEPMKVQRSSRKGVGRMEVSRSAAHPSLGDDMI